jgi:hypothetical protein
VGLPKTGLSAVRTLGPLGFKEIQMKHNAIFYTKLKEDNFAMW